MAVRVDRAAAARFGVSMDAIDQTLYDAFGQRQRPFSPCYAISGDSGGGSENAFPQRPLFWKRSISEGRTLRTEAMQVASARAFARSYPPIPLSAFARSTVTPRRSPLRTRYCFRPSPSRSILADGAALGSAIEALRRAEQRVGLPDTVTTRLAGSAAEFVVTLQNETLLIAAAIITVYILLGMLYESFVHPITILSTLPSAGVGALLA